MMLMMVMISLVDLLVVLKRHLTLSKVVLLIQEILSQVVLNLWSKQPEMLLTLPEMP